MVEGHRGRRRVVRATTASDIQMRLFEPCESLHAPHLLDLETAQVLRQ